MAHAIVRAGGKQFRVSEGEIVRIPSIEAEVGSSVSLEALLTGDGDSVQVGTPVLAGAAVTATVVGHGRGEKIIVFKKKRRKNYSRQYGHRQYQTTVRVTGIEAGAAHGS